MPFRSVHGCGLASNSWCLHRAMAPHQIAARQSGGHTLILKPRLSHCTHLDPDGETGLASSLATSHRLAVPFENAREHHLARRKTSLRLLERKAQADQTSDLLIQPETQTLNRSPLSVRWGDPHHAAAGKPAVPPAEVIALFLRPSIRYGEAGDADHQAKAQQCPFHAPWRPHGSKSLEDVQ